MASNRHLGRIIALQSLYEFDFRTQVGDAQVDINEILQRNLERYASTVDDKDFVTRLVRGVAGRSSELDAFLQPIAPEWPVDQIARVDRCILRMAIFELQEFADVPPKVVINEAVELAKAFGSDNSSKFVNGVLGTAYKHIAGDAPQEEAKEV
jgi:N utilization substance protein B